MCLPPVTLASMSNCEPSSVMRTKNVTLLILNKEMSVCWSGSIEWHVQSGRNFTFDYHFFLLEFFVREFEQRFLFLFEISGHIFTTGLKIFLKGEKLLVNVVLIFARVLQGCSQSRRFFRLWLDLFISVRNFLLKKFGCQQKDYLKRKYSYVPSPRLVKNWRSCRSLRLRACPPALWDCLRSVWSFAASVCRPDPSLCAWLPSTDS